MFAQSLAQGEGFGVGGILFLPVLKACADPDHACCSIIPAKRPYRGLSTALGRAGMTVAGVDRSGWL